MTILMAVTPLMAQLNSSAWLTITGMEEGEKLPFVVVLPSGNSNYLGLLSNGQHQVVLTSGVGTYIFRQKVLAPLCGDEPVSCTEWSQEIQVTACPVDGTILKPTIAAVREALNLGEEAEVHITGLGNTNGFLLTPQPIKFTTNESGGATVRFIPIVGTTEVSAVVNGEQSNIVILKVSSPVVNSPDIISSSGILTPAIAQPNTPTRLAVTVRNNTTSSKYFTYKGFKAEGLREILPPAITEFQLNAGQSKEVILYIEGEHSLESIAHVGYSIDFDTYIHTGTLQVAPIPRTPSLTVDYFAAKNPSIELGQPIVLQIKVTNTGECSLQNVSLSEQVLSNTVGSFSFSIPSLAIGKSEVASITLIPQTRGTALYTIPANAVSASSSFGPTAFATSRTTTCLVL